MVDSSNRKQYLDQVRGLAVFLMLLVNVPGSWGSIYPPLKHAEGNGFTLADLVFPLFLWTVGYSLMVSFSNRKEESSFGFWKRISMRSFILLSMGIFLSLFPKWDWDHFRIPGVLQRIAVLYFCGAVWVRSFSKQTFSFSVFGLFFFVLIFAFLNRFFSFESDLISFVGQEPKITDSLGARIDRLVFGGHIWKETKTYDPEGILSSLPAFLTVLLGCFSYQRREDVSFRNSILQDKWIPPIYLLLAFLFSLLFPLNKTNWSLSFIFLTAFLSELICLFFILWEKGFANNVFGFGLYGRNALSIFFLTGFVTRLGFFSQFRSFLYGELKQKMANPELASLLFSAVYILLISLVFICFEMGKNFFRKTKLSS